MVCAEIYSIVEQREGTISHASFLYATTAVPCSAHVTPKRCQGEQSVNCVNSAVSSWTHAPCTYLISPVVVFFCFLFLPPLCVNILGPAEGRWAQRRGADSQQQQDTTASYPLFPESPQCYDHRRGAALQQRNASSSPGFSVGARLPHRGSTAPLGVRRI